jgi:alpha-L-arabinofuranosidase
VFAAAGRDEAKHEWVLKLINYGDKPFSSRVNLGNVRFESEAEVVTLTSASITDNNSLDQPQFVAPKRSRANLAIPSFNYELPAHSLTILRMKEK